MKIMLIHPNAWGNIKKRGLDRLMTPVLTPLGIASIAAYMQKRSYSIAIIDAHAENIPVQEVILRIKEYEPDILGFSLPIEVTYSASVASEAKRLYPNIITVAGGVIASSVPQLMLTMYPVFDYAVIGEGETAFYSLIKALEQKEDISRVQGIAYRLDGSVRMTPRQQYLEDLNSLPHPAFDLLPNGRYGLFGKGPLALVEASRGCAGNCWFCTIGKMFGNKIRQKSRTRVVDELEECYRKYCINFFGFADSTFTADKNYTYGLLDEIIKRNMHKKIKWRCVTRVDCADHRLLSKMKEAGCVEIGFGVESINQDELNLYKKGISAKNIKDAFLSARRAKISPFALMIVNQYDRDIRKTWVKTVRFLTSIGADHIILRPLVIYPETGLYKKLLDAKQIKNGNTSYFFQGKSPESSYVNFKELIYLMNKMYLLFYIRFGFISVLFKNIPRLKIFYKLKCLRRESVKK
jgi:anaerobic magnesium-protoporphyrin IX monomethyl ester cyclase